MKSSRYFLDTEFIDDGKRIEMVSIGIFSEDGRGYYAENAEADLSRADDWILKNVIPHLSGKKKNLTEIRDEVVAFIGPEKPEFWAYFADYDWFLFCRLFGRLLDLPKGYPHLCLDLKQWALFIDERDIPKHQGIEHHALEDAKWNKEIYDHLLLAQRNRFLPKR